MGSITSWGRLEPQPFDPELGGLAARIGDPLWMLSRQWQTGEWQGVDAGSPVGVRMAYETTPVTRYQAGTAAPVTLTGDRPWERLAEQPAGVPRPDRRTAATGGRRFLDLLGPLADRYGDQLSRDFPLTALAAGDEADDRSRRVVALLAGRVPDGYALFTALTGAGLPDTVEIRKEDREAVRQAAVDWLSWFGPRVSPDEAGGGWEPQGLAHRFRLAAPVPGGETVLSAPAYRDRRVDWTDFDVVPGDGLGAAKDAPVTTGELATLPTGLLFPGMPAPRWWEFEDAVLDFGRVSAAPEDLGRLLLVEFAFVYGNDFHPLPLPVPAGALGRVTSLEVTNSFGETVTIPAASTVDPEWGMFGLTGDDQGWILVPAAAADVMDGEPVEEVLFSRDEMANLGWAVEQRAVGASGWTVRRRETRPFEDPGPPAADAVARYRLMTPVPPHWLPLRPVDGGTRLELAGPAPLGDLLTAVAGTGLTTAELPRSGRLVTRRARRTRWSDGGTHVWTAHEVRAGRGESTAGLTFDTIERS